MKKPLVDYEDGGATQLIVDGKPFLVLGGELHNSSSSSIEYMQPIWQRMLDLSFNTVLAPVSWELVEPREGQFDFTLVDGLIQEAWKTRLACWAIRAIVQSWRIARSMGRRRKA